MAARPQPTLVAGDLTLRPWQTDDAAAVVAAYEDPAIQRWHVVSMTPQEAAAWLEDRCTAWAQERRAEWAVVRDGTLVGRTALRTVDLAEGCAEVAYWVVPAARGAGVAARALTTMTAWAFDDLGLHRLTLLHSSRNEASCRVALRAGYPAEGTQRSAVLHADGWHDMHVHARLGGTAR